MFELPCSVYNLVNTNLNYNSNNIIDLTLLKTVKFG